MLVAQSTQPEPHSAVRMHATELLHMARWYIRHHGAAAERVLQLLLGPMTSPAARRAFLGRVLEAAEHAGCDRAGACCRDLLAISIVDLSAVVAASQTLLRVGAL